MFSLAYSLAGAALSLLVMAIMEWSKLFNLITISTAGGIAHNIGQLMVSCFVFSNIKLLYYGPVLVLSGLITGLIIGIVSLEILKRNTKI
jgi:heptaprenyl diphosphate synthase